jgi:hypothetical protein
MTQWIGIVGLISLTGMESMALAAETTVGGRIYASYSFDLSEGAEYFNEFDVDRAYIDVKSKVTDRVNVRITTDVGRLADGEADAKVRSYLKYAYLEVKDVAPGVKVRVGMAGLGLIATHENFWGHRWVEKSFTDRNKLHSSSDIGLHAIGAHGQLSWQGGLVNGSGYGNQEDDASKKAQLQVGYDLLKGEDSAPLYLFVSHEIGAEDPVTLAAAAGGYSSKVATVWLEGVTEIQGDRIGLGYSVSLVPHFGKNNLVLRYDDWDVDTELEDDNARYVLAGVSHDFAKKLSAGITYKHRLDEADHGIHIQTRVGF